MPDTGIRNVITTAVDLEGEIKTATATDAAFEGVVLKSDKPVLADVIG